MSPEKPNEGADHIRNVIKKRNYNISSKLVPSKIASRQIKVKELEDYTHTPSTPIDKPYQESASKMSKI